MIELGVGLSLQVLVDSSLILAVTPKQVVETSSKQSNTKMTSLVSYISWDEIDTPRTGTNENVRYDLVGIWLTKCMRSVFKSEASQIYQWRASLLGNR